MGEPSAIDQLLAQARAGLDRVQPADLSSEMAAGAVVIDIRPVEQRARDGEPWSSTAASWNGGSTPSSAHRLALAVDSDVRFIVVCNQGYSSSLAAATLRDLELRRATDLVGGFEAWAELQAATVG